MADAKRREPRALVDNAGDPKQVANAQRALKTREDRDDNALRAILAQREGRRALNMVFDWCHAYTTLAGEVENHGRLAYWAGEQNIGLTLMAAVGRAAPEALPLMAKEWREENG